MSDPVAFLVVGGGPAALSAARAFREHGGIGTVLLISDDEALPYARPPLSKEYLRGDVPEQETAGFGLAEPAELAAGGIEVRLVTRVTDLDPDERTVTLADGGTLAYRTCLIATGAQPSTLPVEGAGDPRVHRLRTLADARALRGAAERARERSGRVAVLGSGFIGCEAAVSLARQGLEVTLLSDEPAPQRARLGTYASGRLAGWLAAEGVTLRLGEEVRSVRVEGTGDGVWSVVGTDAGTTTADVVLSATGASPRSELGGDAGLALRDGRIEVDDSMRTSAAGVLAAGDVVAALNAAAGRHLAVEHWGEALAMGEVAGTVAAGAYASWAAVPGFWSQIGDLQLKYAAWGDGFDTEHVVEHPGGGFTVRYGRDGVTVGVLTHRADGDYESGSDLVRDGKPVP